ncbi:spore germination protein [Geosporobacter ferrireducens]|uniref:spore germination protein n=1 Tax=Geosporobacter ferrireducens TaxID=1424294 RepID=UPI002357E791|nr:spore germination protein [Geosporobacter ferrireducens]
MKFLKRLLNSSKSYQKEINIVDRAEYNKQQLSKDININRSLLQKMFKDSDDIFFREIGIKDQEEIRHALLIYASNLVNVNIVNEDIIRPLLSCNLSSPDKYRQEDCFPMNIEEIVSVSKVDTVTDFKELVEAVLSGNTVLILEHYERGLSLSSQGRDTRNIEESNVESIVRGPRDSFIEDIETNIGLIRTRLKSTSLKAKKTIIGNESHTTVYICYMENIVNQQTLEEVAKKLNNIQIDGIFESGYIEQYLESSPYSPFPQMQITERPDKVCGNLLEGRIIILIDGSPQALILPISFFQLFQSPEDYYERILFGNFSRLLRFIGFIVATSLPSIYVALISFHHEMLPMDLVVDLSRTRAQVPFPPVVEALLMEITIELLREASARLPNTIGQTIGIVGAIVIGDAAISANLASPTMIIVVAITAIGSYVLPHYSTSYSLRLIRFPIILMAATFGAFGIIIAWTWIIIHLCSLESFGFPYLSPLAPLDAELKKDAILRGPVWRFGKRPNTANKKNQMRK